MVHRDRHCFCPCEVSRFRVPRLADRDRHRGAKPDRLGAQYRSTPSGAGLGGQGSRVHHGAGYFWLKESIARTEIEHNRLPLIEGVTRCAIAEIR